MSDDNSIPLLPFDDNRSEAREEQEEEIPPLSDFAISNQDAQGERGQRNQGNKMNWRDVELEDDDIDANVILVPKNRRGDFGSRDYLRNLESATAPLDPKMGVPLHFVSSCDGETDARNQMKH